MHLSDDLRKSSESKLLAFPSPVAGYTAPQTSDTLPGLAADLQFGPNPVPPDLSMPGRPAESGDRPRFRIEEQEALAHDARNLMTSLELFTDLLAQPGVLSDQHQHYASDLESLTAPLAALIERMAGAARSEAGPGGETTRVPGRTAASMSGSAPRFQLEPLRPRLRAHPAVGSVSPAGEPCEAGLMVKSCERLLAAIAGPSVALHISYERGLGRLSLDGEALTRVLINLVKNASEAMPHGGRVAITVRQGMGARPCALISVQDSGTGIPAHAMGQIFQAGFSSKKPRARWPASAHHGLGLTIVRDLVEEAGGRVRVVSTWKKGTTFEIKLPCEPV